MPVQNIPASVFTVSLGQETAVKNCKILKPAALSKKPSKTGK